MQLILLLMTIVVLLVTLSNFDSVYLDFKLVETEEDRSSGF